eukprot:TRINITY_DN67080_c6_g6_i1.p1 TRINITY_DN67080_c6_g6~~TRINITY_DN67080_c6_g6_i1.p1  ORF type:complete len:707 (-),score=79.01 TRINITY_DN67080_c6_g6_i1:242-2299(-)
MTEGGENGFEIDVNALLIARFRDADGKLPPHMQGSEELTATIASMCRDKGSKYVDVEPCSLEIRETVRPQQISTKMVNAKVLAQQEEELERREEQRMQRLGALRKVLSKIYVWRRPDQICKAPALFVVGNKVLEIPPTSKVQHPLRPKYMPKFKEGIFDDGFFWTAVSMVVLNRTAFENLFVSTEHADIGMYTFQFYRVAIRDNEASSWKCVTIDDQIPCSADMQPVIGKSFDPDELWTIFLQKAYAKFLGSYSLLHTGDTWEAAVHLTGGKPRLHNWDVEQVSIPTTCTVWWMLNEGYRLGLMQSLVFLDKDEQDQGPGTGIRLLPHFGDDEDARDDDEIFHEWNQTACTPLQTYHVTSQGPNQGLQLVKLRNSFGDFEWNGDWSNESDLWTKDMREMLNHRANDDYTTWMKMDDVVRQYNTILNITGFKGAPTVYFDTLSQQPEGTLPHNAHQYLITITDPKANHAESKVQTATKKKKTAKVAMFDVKVEDEEEADDKPEKVSAETEKKKEEEEAKGPKFTVKTYISQPRRDMVSTGNPKELEVDFFKVKGRQLQSCTFVDNDYTTYNEHGDIVSYQFASANRVKPTEEKTESRFEIRRSLTLGPGNYVLTLHQQFFKDEVQYLVHFTAEDDAELPTGFKMTTEYLGSCAKPKVVKKSKPGQRLPPQTPREQIRKQIEKHNMI